MKTNIVLTGLTGCGKTTLGRQLSKMLNMGFIDTDEDIVELYGPINHLFEKGETYFRDIESRRVKILSQHSNTVISTGGGVILRPSNMEALKKDGLVFYLTRPVEEIMATADPSERPLLKDGVQALARLHRDRKPLYLKYCDHVVQSSDIERALSEIIARWNQRS